MKKNEMFDDLDRLLSSQQEPDEIELEDDQEEGEDGYSLQPYDWPEIKVRGTTVNLVSVLIDDSYSIQDRGTEPLLFAGVKEMIVELQGIARKEKETFLALTGFKGSYFLGDVLSKTPEEIIEQIECTHTSTPLVGTSMRLLRTVNSAEQKLNSIGVAANVHLLLVTDGLPEDDYRDPEDFEESLLEHPHWKILGMGITRDYPRRAEEDRQNFTKVFDSMGIKKIATPSANNIKAVFSSFSKSVSMV